LEQNLIQAANDSKRTIGHRSYSVNNFAQGIASMRGLVFVTLSTTFLRIFLTSYLDLVFGATPVHNVHSLVAKDLLNVAQYLLIVGGLLVLPYTIRRF
jgi:hypothetical protein